MDYESWHGRRCVCGAKLLDYEDICHSECRGCGKVCAVEDLDENGNCAKCAEQNKENNMLSKEQTTEFETLAKPLIKWLNDNTNPHASILIDVDSAQLNYGECIIHTEEFIND